MLLLKMHAGTAHKTVYISTPNISQQYLFTTEYQDKPNM